MRAEKRTWIYSGLAVPAGVGLVQKKVSKQKDPPKKLLLIGNESSRGFVPFFSQLAMIDNAGFRAEIKPQSRPEIWLREESLRALLKSYSPGVVVMSFGLPEDDTMKKLASMVQSAGSKVIAVVPSKSEDPKESYGSIRYFASMASKIWSKHVKG